MIPVAVASATPDPFPEGDCPQVVQLEGNTSFDPDGYAIVAYQWTLVSKPTGSAAALSNPAIHNPTFTADLPGSYLFFLTVLSNDPVPADGQSQTTMRLAPSSALIEVTAETEFFEFSIPALGSRNWAARMQEALLVIDAELGPSTALAVDHVLARTDVRPNGLRVQDDRAAGGPTEDHLASFSSQNAAATGTHNRGAIELDLAPASNAGETTYSFEQKASSADGLAMLLDAWRGLHMKAPAPTGGGVPVMNLVGEDGAEVAAFVHLLAYWLQASNLTFFHAIDDADKELSLRLERLTDPEAANVRRYLRLFLGGTLEDVRLLLERCRLELRRDILAHIKPAADADYNADWGVRFRREGEAAANDPEWRWDETKKLFKLKGTNGTGIFNTVLRGTGAVERTRIEYGELTLVNTHTTTVSVIKETMAFDRVFATQPLCRATLVGADKDMEEKVGAVYAAPEAGSELSRLVVEVNAQVGETFAQGQHVTVAWEAIGQDTE